MRLSVQTLIQSEWSPYKKGKIEFNIFSRQGFLKLFTFVLDF